MHIDRDDYTPLYIQFYQLMVEEISACAPGTTLPPERVLCEKYGLDRVTVRKALSMLSDEGLIERKQGRGTTVLPRTPNNADREKGMFLFALYHGSHLVDRIGEPFYAKSLDEIEKYLHHHNERMMYSKIRQGNILSALCKHLNAKGVILAGALDEDIIKQCKDLDIPVVTYNSRFEGLPYVKADNEESITKLVRHLIDLGHKRIGYITVPGHLNSSQRLSQVSQLMSASKLGVPVIAEGDWSEQGGYNASMKLLQDTANPVTAIFAGNDSMAIGTLRAVHETGLKVPEDISVVGFDGIAQSAVTSPPLTTFQTDISTMTEAACMLVTHMITNGVNPNMGVVVSGQMIIRKSTGRAKA